MELYNIYHTMSETGLAEYSPYSNETVDKYMDEALESSDLESSYDLWKKALSISSLLSVYSWNTRNSSPPALASTA